MLWEELTAIELKKACEVTKGVCVIPFGVIEKHGTHLPLGTDMYAARRVAVDAARIEPFVIFPYYFFGQINEARHVPGTVAIQPDLMYSLLDEVCSEISRNGFKKIVIINSHGGNRSFVSYFIQSTLYKKKDYMVYEVSMGVPEEKRDELSNMFNNKDWGSHAGNMETSMIMAEKPELVRMDQIEAEGINAYGRLRHLKETYTAIGWYAEHPTHFAGDPSEASPEAGKKAFEYIAANVAEAIKIIKEDEVAKQLQDQFFNRHW